MIDDIKKTLWATADKLRANMDAAEYKHLVLGLIFVKYISDIRAASPYRLQRRAFGPRQRPLWKQSSSRLVQERFLPVSGAGWQTECR